MAVATSNGAEAVTGPSLGVRLVLQAAEPGGAPMTRQMLDGAGVGRSARVLALAPGLAPSMAAALSRWPREWIGVEPVPSAARVAKKALEPRTPGPLGLLETFVHGQAPAPTDLARIVEAPLAATGVEAESVTSAYGEGVLVALDDEAAVSVLREVARTLRPGGRAAFHEVALAPGATPAAAAALSDAGLRALTVHDWRRLAGAAGLVPTGETHGALIASGRGEEIRRLGLPTVLRRDRIANDHQDAKRSARRIRSALETHAKELEAIVVLAERPLIAGLRMPTT